MFKDLNLKLHPVAATATQPATIVLSSIAGAADYQGTRLGEYVQADEEYGGRVDYKQRQNVAGRGEYIYKEGGRWYVSEILGGPVGLRSQETGALLPPTKNWEYTAGGKWRNDDASLTLTFASLPTPCPIVRVAGEGDVVEKQGSSLGDYRFDFINVLHIMHVIRIQVPSSPRYQSRSIPDRLEKGLWSSGRPIFKKEDGGIERVLLVPNGITTWSIKTSTSSSGARITSGRATDSPTMPEAGPSEKMDKAGWVYWAEDKWIVGSISVTCVE